MTRMMVVIMMMMMMMLRYFAYLEKCEDAKACTVILRGGSKDVLNEIERNLQDAMQVVRNVVFDPRLLPGGGAAELAIATAIEKSADSVEGIARWPYLAIGTALSVIPRTLAENCGANVIRLMADLRSRHWNSMTLTTTMTSSSTMSSGDGSACACGSSSSSSNSSTWGVNGNTGEPADMTRLGIWEPYCVKVQTLKTAIESSCLILRIDDVVSGTRKKKSEQ